MLACKTQRVPARQEVRDLLSELLFEVAKVPRERITETATIDNDLQMQSITFVELQVAIEEAYNIQLDPIQVVELNQFGAIVDYVYRCALGENR
jgi:acyl carrier protein